MVIKRKNYYCGKISFILAVLIVIYIMIKTILGFCIINKINRLTVEMNMIFAMSIISFILGIIELVRKEFNKRLCVFSLIVSGSIVIPIIIIIFIAYLKY